MKTQKILLAGLIMLSACGNKKNVNPVSLSSFAVEGMGETIETNTKKQYTIIPKKEKEFKVTVKLKNSDKNYINSLKFESDNRYLKIKVNGEYRFLSEIYNSVNWESNNLSTCDFYFLDETNDFCQSLSISRILYSKKAHDDVSKHADVSNFSKYYIYKVDNDISANISGMDEQGVIYTINKSDEHTVISNEELSSDSIYYLKGNKINFSYYYLLENDMKSDIHNYKKEYELSEIVKLKLSQTSSGDSLGVYVPFEMPSNYITRYKIYYIEGDVIELEAEKDEKIIVTKPIYNPMYSPLDGDTNQYNCSKIDFYINGCGFSWNSQTKETIMK